MKRVTSRQNPIVARFRDIARRRSRDDCLVMLDGWHLLEEALASGIEIEVVAFTDKAFESGGPDFAARLERAGARLCLVSDKVMPALSPVSAPSGVVALARRPANSVSEVLERRPQLLVIAAGIQEPGNLGAIVRSAEALGATGFVAAGAGADPFGWKALRGAMGSAFRMRIAVERDTGKAIGAVKEAGAVVLAAVPSGGQPAGSVDLTRPVALLVGGEGGGISPDLAAMADESISIPMRPPVESLNVAVAAALLLFEASRQRGSF